MLQFYQDRLLEMANGAVYNDSHEVVEIHDKKLQMLEELIEEAVGQNVLVAYWYQHDRIQNHQVPDR
jgi:hypothetical protein